MQETKQGRRSALAVGSSGEAKQSRIFNKAVEVRKRPLIPKQVFPKALCLVAPEQQEASEKSGAARISQIDKASADRVGAPSYGACSQPVCQWRRDNLRIGAIEPDKSGRNQRFNSIENGVRVGTKSGADNV